jgi:hypothetical protein
MDWIGSSEVREPVLRPIGKEEMAVRLAKEGKKHGPRPAYLPMFAMMNPTAYAKWNPALEKSRMRRSVFR